MSKVCEWVGAADHGMVEVRRSDPAKNLDRVTEDLSRVFWRSYWRGEFHHNVENPSDSRRYAYQGQLALRQQNMLFVTYEL